MTEGYPTRDDALRALRVENANLRKLNEAQREELDALIHDIGTYVEANTELLAENEKLREANAAQTERISRLMRSIEEKGGNEHAPTQWAYEQACAAVEKHRQEAANLRKVNEAQEKRIGELEKDARALTSMIARMIE